MARSFDLIIIGTGAAASTVAHRCRSAGCRVAVVDRRPYGGTCRLRGCDPKKLIWGVAEAAEMARRFAGEGVAAAAPSLDWPELIRFKRAFLAGASDAAESQFREAGIETLHGTARFVDPGHLRVGDEICEARRFVIASGAIPTPLPISGAEHLLTSEDFLEAENLADSLVFVGGGFISFEFAHIAARAGRKITLLHGDDRPLARFEPALVARILEKSRRLGMDIRLEHMVEAVERDGAGVKVWARHQGERIAFSAGAAIHGAGRVPDLDDLDLEAGGIARDGARLSLNPFLQSTSNPAVFAAGDAAAMGPMLTPVCGLDGGIVAENLLAEAPHARPDYTAVPSVVFTIPPLAAVGLTEEAARAAGRRFRVAEADTAGWYSSRRLKEDTAGFKVLIEEGTDRILGAHVVGPDAEELINLFALALTQGSTAAQLRRPVTAYPSQGSNLAAMLA